MEKRLSKHEYFFEIAKTVRLRSPDLKTQVGAVLVDTKDRIIGTGFNGPPAGYEDKSLDWLDERGERKWVYDRVVHAEMNAILYSGARYDDRAKLYVTLSPCKDCIKLLAAAGIKTIHFIERYKDYDIVLGLAQEFGIKLIQHEVQRDG